MEEKLPQGKTIQQVVRSFFLPSFVCIVLSAVCTFLLSSFNMKKKYKTFLYELNDLHRPSSSWKIMGDILKLFSFSLHGRMNIFFFFFFVFYRSKSFRYELLHAIVERCCASKEINNFIVEMKN